jgi:DNA polymerase-1
MKTLAMDNETYLITRTRPAPKVVCTSLYDGNGEAELAIAPDLLPLWQVILEDDEIEIVGLNIAYDMITIASTYPQLLELVFEKYEKNLVTDAGIRQQIWDIAVGRALADDRVQNYSLASLARVIFDESMEGKKGDDIWRLRYSELDGVPLSDWPQAAVDYAKGDAVMTWRVWEAQNEVQDDIRYEHERTYTAFALALIENHGMRTNATAVAKCKALHQKTIDKLRPGLIDCGLIKPEKKKGEIVYVKKAKPARERVVKGCLAQGTEPPLTKTGWQRKRSDPGFTWRDEPKYVATDKVAALLSQDSELIKRVEYSTAEKMISTYIPTLEAGVSGPITTRFGIAATGRTTSSAPGVPKIGTNFQSVPRTGGLRECFYPRPGHVFLAADYEGAELHTLAQTCKDKVGFSVLGDRLEAGDDVHLFVAAQLLGISFDEAKKRKREKGQEILDARQDAKAANFGFPGGMRERTFINTQIKQRERFWKYDDVVELREAWLTSFPEMDEYFDHCKTELGPQGKTVIELAGSEMLRTVKGLPMCANTFFQSLAGVGALSAIRELARRMYTVDSSALYGARMCNFVHDEAISENNLDADLDAAATEKKYVMETWFNKFVPDYPVKVEPVLMSFWSKKAEPVFDSAGRLTIWNG